MLVDIKYLKVGFINKTTKDKTNSMTEEEFLGLITIISMLGLGIIAVIWWIGTNIVHELRYRNHLLKEQNEKRNI